MGIAIIGGLVILVSVFFAEQEGLVGDIASWCVLFGLMLMIIGLLTHIKPIEVDAESLSMTEIGSDEVIMLDGGIDLPTAGVTAHMNTVLENSLNDTQDGKNVSEEDIDLLARLITAEQGYADNYDDEEEYEERIYLTGSVVINRIKSEKFPNELKEVIYQHVGERYQYQCVKNGHIDRPYDELAWEVAEELLVYGTVIDEEVVYQSEFQQGSEVYRQIGNTFFCYQ